MATARIIFKVPIDPLLKKILIEAESDARLAEMILKLHEAKELFEIPKVIGSKIPVHLTDKALNQYYKYKGL